jgi:hypothetical protein
LHPGRIDERIHPELSLPTPLAQSKALPDQLTVFEGFLFTPSMFGWV